MLTANAKDDPSRAGYFRRILIVDDNTDLADATADALRALGYETLVAYTFDESLARVDATPADIALIDIRLGADDGIELIAALRERQPTILCVLVTGDANTQSAVRGLRSGAFDYLSKPVDIDLLDTVLRRCSDRLTLEAEKEAAERALAESEARFRAFFDNTPVSLSVKDLHNRYLMINKAHENWLGRTPDEIFGRTLLEVVNNEDRVKALENIEQAVIETGQVQEKEVKVKLPNGRVYDRHIVKFPIRSNDGELIAVGTVGIDVTDKNDAQRARAESEQLLRTFIDHSDATMNLKDLDGRYLMVNETFRKLRGRCDFIGKTYRETGGGPDADRQEMLERRVIETGEIQNGEDLIEYANGNSWLRRYTKFPVYDIDGAMMGVGSIGVDMSENRRTQERLRTSEAQLRAIIDNYPWRINLIGMDGRILLANEAFARERNLNVEDVVGKSAVDLETPDVATAVLAHNAAAIESRNAVRQERERFDSDGKRRQLSIIKFPAYDADGALMGVGTISMDVTERKNAEEALRESEALLRSIIDSSTSPISLKDRNHKFVVANNAFEELFGRANGTIVNNTADSVVSDDHAAMIRAHEQQVIESGKTVSQERVTTLPNGRHIECIVTKFPVFDADGSVKLLGTMMTDISDRKRAEEALQRSEQQLRLVIDSLPIGIGYFSADERYVLVNKTSASWYRTAPEKIAGKRIADVQKSTYPNFREQVKRTLAGESVTFEAKADYPDGVTRDVLVTNVPDFWSNGEVRGFFGMAQDISERKEAERRNREFEERFRAVIDNSPAAIILKDTDGRFLIVNETFRKWWNLDPDFDFTGKSVLDFMPEDVASQVTDHERRVAASGIPEVDERELTFGDGVTRRILVHKFPVLGADGTCTAVGTINVDFTEQRALQAQLSQVQKMEAVGQLTGGVAHDFNNLLGVVIGNLDFLSEALQGNEDLLQLVEPAMKAALSGAHLTRQLLAFSRKQSLMPKVIDLNDHVSGMMELLQRTLGETIDVETNLATAAQTVKVDPGQLGSVLLNLAVNARDAMSDGGTLTISTAVVSLSEEDVENRPEVIAGDYALLTVTDKGAGMTPEVLRQVFNPFFTTKETGEGSGLGLSMVFGFTKQSGGHVEIESEVGEGTTVRLYLPYVGRDTENGSEPENNLLHACGERLLVVEDDPALLKLALQQVRSLGYQAIAARDGGEALDILASEAKLDLILSDIVMPGGLSGILLAEEARQRHPDIKVVFMSGYSSDAIDQTAFNDLDAPLLRKPFRKAALAKTLRQVFETTQSATA